MSNRCGGSPVKTTFRKVLQQNHRLPKLEMAVALVTGCGGSEADKQLFASAWQAIRAGHAIEEEDGCGEQPRHLRPVDGIREFPA